MSREGFEWAWTQTLTAVADGGDAPVVSTELEPLVAAFYTEACQRPADSTRVRASLCALLEFLATAVGTTADDLKVTGHFLIPGDEFWEEDWGDLDEETVEILGLLSYETSQSDEAEDGAPNRDALKQILDELRRGG